MRLITEGDMGTDQFDDFEFKPITEGLGFHDKVREAKAQPQRQKLVEEHLDREMPSRPDPLLSLSLEIDKPASQSLTDMMNSLPPSMDFIEDQEEQKDTVSQQLRAKKENKADINQPEKFNTISKTAVQDMIQTSEDIQQPSGNRQLISGLDKSIAAQVEGTSAQFQVETEGQNLPPVQSNPVVESERPRSKYKERVDASLAKAFPKVPVVERPKAHQTALQTELRLEAIPTSMMAGLLDAIVVAGLSLICLVSLLMITQVDLLKLLLNASTSVSAFVQLSILFCGVLQLYYLSSRGLFGATLGDWAFDQQLGTEEDRNFVAYPILVLWRSVLNTITGFIFFPILSKIWKKDILGVLSGLNLYQRN